MEILLSQLQKSVKNDYSFSFKKGRVTTYFLPYVQTPVNALKWVFNFKHPKTGRFVDWDCVYVYDRRSRAYLGTLNLSRSILSTWI